MTTSMFADRLDFLMRLTNTQNSALARALNFDASYISRIRSGRRGMPRHQPFVEPAAAYFAARLTEPYQRKAIADAVCRGREWPSDEGGAIALIVAWLGGDGAADGPVDQLLEDIVALSRRGMSLPAAGTHGGQDDPHPSDEGAARGTLSDPVAYFFGDEGKRVAVELFLRELLERDEPTELLLLSDERMTWLYDDPDFERRWASLLARIADDGGSIRIVHTIDRDLDQMLGAIRGWLPLYMTGAVEPWWCPRVRDGIYRRTLFIARGHVAIASSSINDDTDGMLNIVLRDAAAVAALEREYGNYLALCRPLMRFESFDSAEALAAWLRGVAADVRSCGDDVMLCDVGGGEFALLAHEGTNVVLFRKVSPSTAAIVDEWSLASSFWEYLLRAQDVFHGGDEVAARLEQTVASLA